MKTKKRVEIISISQAFIFKEASRMIKVSEKML